MKQILFFDSYCVVCNWWVRFVLRHDKEAILSFAPMYGETSSYLLQAYPKQDLDFNEGVIYLDKNSQLYQGELAILKALEEANIYPRWVYCLRRLPNFIVHGLYSLLAKNRYRLFSKLEQCPLPRAEHQKRFLK